MGRPRVCEEKRVVTAVRLPESVHRRLHLVAGERDVSANHLVTRAVASFLDQLGSAGDPPDDTSEWVDSAKPDLSTPTTGDAL